MMEVVKQTTCCNDTRVTNSPKIRPLICSFLLFKKDSSYLTAQFVLQLLHGVPASRYTIAHHNRVSIIVKMNTAVSSQQLDLRNALVAIN